MYAVMKAYPVSCIQVNGVKITPEEGQPQHIIPVFETYQEAVAWHGSFHDIAKLDVKADETA